MRYDQTITVNSRRRGNPVLFGIVFGGIFVMAGLVFAAFIGYQAMENLAEHDWAAHTCVIDSARIDTVSSRDEPFEFKVSYHWQYQGQTYHSSRAASSEQKFSNYKDAQDLLDRFSVDSSVTCYLNPNDPADALLIQGSLWLFVLLLFPLLFVVVGVVVARSMIKGNSVAQAPSSIAISQKKGGSARIPLLILWLSFAVIGFGTLIPFFVLPVLKVVDAHSWLRSEATVEYSRVKQHDSDDGSTYSVDILFSYIVDGKEYKSNTYSFFGGSTSGYSGKKEVVDQYPVGQRFLCYVNPDDPADAVIEPSFTATMLFGLIPLTFALIGVGGLCFLPAKQDNRAPLELMNQGVRTWPQTSSGSASSPFTPDVSPAFAEGTTLSCLGRSAKVAEYLPSGEVMLKCRVSAWGKLIGSIFVAIFWNGIVSVFAAEMIEGWTKGNGSWFLTIFLCPFLLIGFSLVLLVIYQFLAFFNPKLNLILAHEDLRLGETVRFRWQIIGNHSRISRLKISLRGVEEAVYRRGTNTYTDTETFYEKCLVDIASSNSISQGQGELQVPADLIHSFCGDNNRIRWLIRVSGEIKFWPDVDEEYELRVLPKFHQDV